MTATVFPTMDDVLATQADRSAEAVALLAPGRTPLSYGELRRQALAVTARLRSWGIGRNDRVAVVMPDGPEMAVAFLSIASGAAFAPLNPAYRAAEFEFFLSDLKPKVLILGEGADSPAFGVAQELRIPLAWLVCSLAAPAGTFTLAGGQGAPAARQEGAAQSDDVALVLHTSGTTGRPKIVPLTHRNLCASAGHIVRTLHLTPQDRSLSVMPMFHIHPLIASILASVVSGGSAVCPAGGFQAPSMMEWLETFRPTWYTAAPAIHQAVLARAMENPRAAAQSSLRFIRSGAAVLSEEVRSGLERAFNIPVLECYGMTEAAGPVTHNPLPPGPRKPGSGGPAAGTEAAIMAEGAEDLLAVGEVGEIVVRGANVICGYADNPEANARAFVNGWFRTGDQGYVDADGYFYVTGRLKELINRGGEKLSPQEIDRVLLQHPTVVQAVTFGMPDAVLGEDVAAAVVLRDKAVTEGDLRRFVALHLAHFKVPRRIAIVDELPRTAAGKVQRGGLAERLGLLTGSGEAATEPRPSAAPRTEVEETLAGIWSDVLKVPAVGVHQNFLELGGDSILAAQLLARVRRVWNLDLSLFDLFERPTVAGLAACIEQAAATAGSANTLLTAETDEREELEL